MGVDGDGVLKFRGDIRGVCGGVINLLSLLCAPSYCTVPGAARAYTHIAWRMARVRSPRQRRCSGSAEGVRCVTCVGRLVQTPSSGAQTAGTTTIWSAWDPQHTAPASPPQTAHG